MAGVQDFISLPKTDRLNYLGIGMRYASFVSWAGYEIPGFPGAVSNTYELIDNVIKNFIVPRGFSGEDVHSVLSLAIQAAVEDNVRTLLGTIDFSMLSRLGNESLYKKVYARLEKRYSEKIKLIPEFAFGPTVTNETILKHTPHIIQDNLFKSISFYTGGPHDTETYKEIFMAAEKAGMARRALVTEMHSPREVINLIQAYHLTELMGGTHLAKDKDALKFLADNKIVVNVSPARDVYFKAVSSYAEFPIKPFLDAGVRLTINTCGLLVYQKTISEQCAALANAGAASVEELKALL